MKIGYGDSVGETANLEKKNEGKRNLGNDIKN